MKGKRIWAAILAVALIVTALVVPQGSAYAAENGMVRVYLASLNYYGSITSLTFTTNGSYAIESRPEIILSSRGSYTVQLLGNTLYLSGDGLASSVDMGTSFTLKQYTDAEGKLGAISFYNPRYGNRSYRGDMKFDIKDGGLRLINRVYLEDYLYGVLAGELSNSFPLECLKAQAIIARSYVYNRMISGQPNYEINDTSSDQVYKGYNSANDVIMRAVNETAGVLLKYGNSYVNAYFGASNGGQIELPRNAWSGSGSSLGCYVMKDDPYDLRNPQSRTASYSFSADMTTSWNDLSNLIQQKLYSQVGSWVTPKYINSVTLSDPVTNDPASVGISRNYKTMNMNVSYDDGSGIPGSADIRFDLDSEIKYLLFGNDSDLRLFSLQQNGSSYTLTLARYGHGVGMSQRGAQQMANEGKNYDEIIHFYFNDVVLETRTFQRDETTQNAVNSNKPVIGTGTVNASSLNVRSKPSTSASRLGTVTRGSKVSITAKLDGWYEINYGADVGYVSAEYILVDSLDPNAGTTADPNAQQPADPETPIGTGVVTLSVSSSTLNLRSAASSASSIVQRLPNGTQLTVYEKTATNWYRVKTAANVAGFVSADYVRFTPAATTTDPNAPDTTAPETPTTPDTQAPAPTVTGKVKLNSSSTLNVRASSSTSSSVIGRLRNGDSVVILAELNGWYKISYGTGVGYVSMQYVTDVTISGGQTGGNATQPGTSTTPEVPSSGVLGGLTEAEIPDGGVRGVVQIESGTTLTIYSDLNKSTTLGYLENGSGVTVIGVVDDLYYIRADAGTKGFVYKKYILTATGSAPDGTKPDTQTSDSGNNTGSTGNTGSAGNESSVFAQGKIQLSNTNSTLRLRKEPSTSSAILANMRHGTDIEIISSTGDWYKIIYQDYKGYVMKSYVKISSGTVEEEKNTGSTGGTTSGSDNSGSNSGTTVSGTTVYIARITLSSASSTVNVRAGAGSSYSAIGSFPHGEKVYVIASNGDWYKVVYGSSTGYVLKSYVRLTGETGVLDASGKVTEGASAPSTDSNNNSSNNNTGSNNSALVGKTAYINLSSASATLNVRSGPGTDYSIAFVLKHGTKVTINSDHGTWYGISYNDRPGYVSAKYVALESGSGSSTDAKPAEKKTAKTTAAVNLRATNSASGEKLGTYSKGTTVTILEKGDSWSKVQVGTKTGYMKNTYLQFA